ncbi:MAG: hypothetical protein AAGA31_15275, partial [Bacteroidota bacterium]
MPKLPFYLRFLLLFAILPLLCTCERAQNAEVEALPDAPIHKLAGEAMGSYYRVTYVGDTIPRLKERIDSLLEAYNLELSAWVPASKLNAFNASDAGISVAGTDHFI